MNVLLATPELEPLTGSTPLGRVARRVALELQACPDAAVSVTLPASDEVLRSQAGNLIEGGALAAASPAAPQTAARILRWYGTGGPDVFLIDAPSLRGAFDPAASEASRAGGALTWARLVLALHSRVRPPVHILHALGWESALLPVLAEARELPVATALSAAPAQPASPSLRAVLEAARRAEENFPPEAAPEDTLEQPLQVWAAPRAGAIDALPDFALEPASADYTATTARPADTRRTLGLDPEKEAAVFFVPGRFPGGLLPVLPRLLDAGAQVITAAAPTLPGATAELDALAASRPGCLARLDEAGAPNPGPAAALAAADFVLLHPAAGADSALARDAPAAGCTPVLPAAHPSLANLSGRRSPLRDCALVFRDDSPEAVLARLRDAIALRKNPAAWSAHREKLKGIPGSTPGIPPPIASELSPPLASLYHRAVARALCFDD